MSPRCHLNASGLGIDIARIAEVPHRAAVEAFLQLVSDPDEARHALMQQRGPARWRTEAGPLQRRLDALRQGLAAVAA